MIIKIIINIKNTILKKEVNNREEESHRPWSEITGAPSNLRPSGSLPSLCTGGTAVILYCEAVACINQVLHIKHLNKVLIQSLVGKLRPHKLCRASKDKSKREDNYNRGG